MNGNTDMQFIVTIMGNSKHIISQGIITLTAFIVGIGAGVLIQFYISKLPMSKIITIFVYIISLVASLLYLLEVFGQLDNFLHYMHTVFT